MDEAVKVCNKLIKNGMDASKAIDMVSHMAGVSYVDLYNATEGARIGTYLPHSREEMTHNELWGVE